MVRLLKQLLSSQKGQALPIVLCMLALGGLTIAVSLDYATTSLKGSQIINESTKGIYAAGAGVEHSLWSLSKSYEPLTQLPENVSQMEVSMSTDNQGTFTLCWGELVGVKPGVHVDWVDVDTEMVWDEVEAAYKYTITVTYQEVQGQGRKLIEVGARIPVGYSYVPGSVLDFPDNLSTEDPPSDIDTDAHGAYMLKWTLPKIVISDEYPEKTQAFYITGTGDTAGEYAWVAALSQDVGVVGEITGTRYKITAVATRPEDGRITARIVADVVIRDDGTMFIVSWQITK